MMKIDEPKGSIPFYLYNTESRSKEQLIPIEDNHIKMYTCGPTVYNYAHIGNFRTYIAEDLLRRTIKFFGMKVTQVMNLTDIDDKTIKGALTKDLSLLEFTKPYKEAFFEDLKILNIEPVEYYPAATDYIPDMFVVIEDLLKKGIAYRGGDNCVYYAIKKFKRYGYLSHLHLDELQAGASMRVECDEYDKENAADFVLWKAYDPLRDGKIYWDSPFGPGRPGWHLECSVMAMKILGPSIDIHAGGVDNMFPHHENEIAQSEAYSGASFVKLWMHVEHLVVDHKKMSKSLGNFYTLRDLLGKGYTGLQIRYLLLQTHYKTQLNFTMAGLEAAKKSLQRLQDFIQRLETIANSQNTIADTLVDPICLQTRTDFYAALGDDMNISAALAVIFDCVRVFNGLIDAGKIGKKESLAILELIKSFNAVLGVLSFENISEAIPLDMQEALEKRIQARKEKNWALSDILRDEIAARGYIIEDTLEGARLKKNI